MLLAAETYTGAELRAAGPVHRLGNLEVALDIALQILEEDPNHLLGLAAAAEAIDRHREMVPVESPNCRNALRLPSTASAADLASCCEWT